MKRCKDCGEQKPLADFYRSAGMADGHRNDCRACNLAAKARRYAANPGAEIDRVRRWQEQNPERVKANRQRRRARPEVKLQEREAHLRRKYGIGLDEYERMLAEQGGGCAICERPPRQGSSLHVDHDHETGFVRGLLCFNCNNAIGDFGEDAVLLGRAAGYVSRGEAPDEVALARVRAFALVGG